MSKILQKFMTSNSADDTVIRLRNDQYLRARNGADSGDVSIIKADNSNLLQFASVPYVADAPTDPNQLTRKAYVDAGLANWESSAPTGTINGSNQVFTLPAAALGNTSIFLFINGLLQRYGTDYTRTGTTLTFTTAPASGSDIWVMYPKG